MRKLVIAVALATAACNGGPNTIPTAPAEVMNKTLVDEQAAQSAEILYTTASRFGNSLSRSGVIDRARFQELDQRAYNQLLVVRRAYQAGNSESFIEGLANLNLVIAEIRDLKKD